MTYVLSATSGIHERLFTVLSDSPGSLNLFFASDFFLHLNEIATKCETYAETTIYH